MPKYVNKLQNKHIVIFSGTSDISYRIAEASVEHGAKVTVLTSNPTKPNAPKSRLQNSLPESSDFVSGQTINFEAPDNEDQLVFLF